MKDKFKVLWGRGGLAFVGVLAFALSSVYAMTQLFMAQAQHPTYFYILPAIFVEIVTAVGIWSAVDNWHKATRSNARNQDKAFYGKLWKVLLVLTLPSFMVSILANYWEFGGFVRWSNWVFPITLGLLYPSLATICAILGGIPNAVANYKAELDEQRIKPARAAKQKAQPLPTLQRRNKIFAKLCKDSNITTQTFAKALSVSEQSIRNDLRALAKAGKIQYQGGKVKVLPQLVRAVK